MVAKQDQLSDDERQLVRAIREITVDIAKTFRDLRPTLLAKYGLSEAKTNVAISMAIALNAEISMKTAFGVSLHDSKDLDADIVKLILENRSKLEEM